MKPLRTLLCEKHGLPETEFSRYLFWRCLYPHATALVPLFGGFNGSYFAADRDLITNVGEITTRKALQDEIIDYFMDPGNRLWCRRVARVRVSTTALKRVVGEFLTNGDSTHPVVGSRPPLRRA
ncbi:MAG TPA: hypothetical protein VHE61_21560 [Opitutaceae bacterium]|nr:hypothetical protein [Opitutaceae bacterium]